MELNTSKALVEAALHQILDQTSNRIMEPF